jgi:membrane dipeptidase
MRDLTEEELQRAEEIHKSSTVVDTHNDTILHLIDSPPFIANPGEQIPPRRRLGERSEHGQIDIPRIIEGGVNCLIFAMYVNPHYSSRLLRLLQMLDTFQREIEENKDTIAIVKNYNEITETIKKGKIAALISVEGGEPLEGKIETLRTIYRLGVRSLTLTHFPRNQLGDGSGAASGSHLTEFGKEVVQEMNKLGMIIDISHLNEAGFWDVIELTKEPILATHSNCKALCSHHRNLTDEQIKAVSDTGGVLNLSFCGSFLKNGIDFGDKASLEELQVDDWLDHLDHAVNLVGSEYVGIGSDLDGGCGFPDLEDITKFPRLTQGMVYRGYSEKEIKRILGENNMRVFREVLN